MSSLCFCLFNLGGRRSHHHVTVDPLSARQQRPFTDRYRGSPSGQKIPLSLNISYSQICRILFWKTRWDMRKTRGTQESLERHMSDCFKILMKLKLFIMNTGAQPLGRLNYKQILGEFLHMGGNLEPPINLEHIFVPPGPLLKLTLMLTLMPNDVAQRCQDVKNPKRRMSPVISSP